MGKPRSQRRCPKSYDKEADAKEALLTWRLNHTMRTCQPITEDRGVKKCGACSKWHLVKVKNEPAT